MKGLDKLFDLSGKGYPVDSIQSLGKSESCTKWQPTKAADGMQSGKGLGCLVESAESDDGNARCDARGSEMGDSKRRMNMVEDE